MPHVELIAVEIPALRPRVLRIAAQLAAHSEDTTFTKTPYRTDVALGTFHAGITVERKIGASMYEGNNGNPGTMEINGWYPVDSVVPPEFIQAQHNLIPKSGQATGSTIGFIDLPCTQSPVILPWSGGTTRG
jgi:hypothetical protein